MNEYLHTMWISATVIVIAQVLFFGGSLQISNLILWAIIGAIIGAVNKTLDLLFRESKPTSSFMDKVVTHPIMLVVNGIATGLIVGTSIGGYAGNAIGGSVIGGVIGLVLAVLLVFRDDVLK
jgi:hypothetical protein